MISGGRVTGPPSGGGGGGGGGRGRGARSAAFETRCARLDPILAAGAAAAARVEFLRCDRAWPGGEQAR